MMICKPERKGKADCITIPTVGKVSWFKESARTLCALAVLSYRIFCRQQCNILAKMQKG